MADEQTPLVADLSKRGANVQEVLQHADTEPEDDASNLVMRDSSEEEHERSAPLTVEYVLHALWDNLILIVFVVLLSVLLIFAAVYLWTGLSWKAWFSIYLTVFTLGLLLKDALPAYFVLIMAMTLILLFNIIDADVALEGFANEGVLTIAVLFVVAKAVEVNKALDLFIKYVLGKPRSLAEAQIRMILPVGLFSAFLNNTPLVAMMIPVVSTWARSSKLPVSRLMIPLSYAAVLGGVCTIIGTSTNLIVKGLLEEADPTISLGFFEIAVIGVPLFLICTVYIILASPYLLPDNTQAMDQFLQNPREYTAAVRVEESSPLVSLTVEKAGLRNLGFVYLFQVVRGQEVFPAPDSSFVIEANDLLFFTGVIAHMQIIYAIEGVTPATNQVSKVIGRLRNRCLVEVVVAKSSPLVGKTVRETRFRSKYNAAIIGIHRYGVRVDTPIGDIVFQPGDTLLCEAHKSFLRYHSNDQDFSLVNVVGERSVWKKQRVWKTVVVGVLISAMIALATAEVVDLLAGSLAVSCIFLLTRIVKFPEARQAVQGDVIVLIAAAFSLGNALDKTGAAKEIADSLIVVLEPLGAPFVLAGLYLITTVLTEVISNAATVTLIFPIAYQFVEQGLLTPKAMAYTLMLAGSSSFCTPIGYQTNLMVQQPGGYKFVDYVKFGLPLNAVAMAVTVTLASLIFQRPAEGGGSGSGSGGLAGWL